jgi:hypothetical protein
MKLAACDIKELALATGQSCGNYISAFQHAVMSGFQCQSMVLVPSASPLLSQPLVGQIGENRPVAGQKWVCQAHENLTLSSCQTRRVPKYRKLRE